MLPTDVSDLDGEFGELGLQHGLLLVSGVDVRLFLLHVFTLVLVVLTTTSSNNDTLLSLLLIVS